MRERNRGFRFPHEPGSRTEPAMTTPAALASPSGSKILTARIAMVLSAQFCFGLAWSTYLVIPKFLATELHADPRTISHVTVMSPAMAVVTMPFAVAVM